MGKKRTDNKKINIDKLFLLIKTLRSENGCPWDKKQTPESMAKHLLHEAHEAYEAIITDQSNICEELGDTLFQLIFIIFLFEEAEEFSLQDVIDRVHAKMISRHPHVFSNKKAKSIKDVEKIWGEVKRKEKKEKFISLLGNIPPATPALMRAEIISKKAVQAGFDWDSYAELLDQFSEEVLEFKEANQNKTNDEAELEFGDILFTLVNIGRELGFDAESALLKSTCKFEKRFKNMEKKALNRGIPLSDLPRDELEKLWKDVKKLEKTN